VGEVSASYIESLRDSLSKLFERNTNIRIRGDLCTPPGSFADPFVFVSQKFRQRAKKLRRKSGALLG